VVKDVSVLRAPATVAIAAPPSNAMKRASDT
jgi:hypothetical protein